MELDTRSLLPVNASGRLAACAQQLYEQVGSTRHGGSGGGGGSEGDGAGAVPRAVDPEALVRANNDFFQFQMRHGPSLVVNSPCWQDMRALLLLIKVRSGWCGRLYRGLDT